MARRTRGASKGGRVRYSWHGFYMNTPLAPADVLLDIFVLYDPLDDDHQEEVVHERTLGTMWARNPDTSTESTFGFGIYVCQADEVRTIGSKPDPLGIAAFDIEANWTLYQASAPLPIEDAAGNIEYVRWDFNVKARRKISDPQMLVLIALGSAASRWRYQFNARSLIREGRF